MSDIAAMMLGFWLARTAPVWVSLAFVIVMEIAVAMVIRDNLTLNILMLIHPFEAIKQWQLGGRNSEDASRAGLKSCATEPSERPGTG